MCLNNGNDSKEDNNEVRIQWRVADIKIPTRSEIKNITQDQDIPYQFLEIRQQRCI